MKSKKTDGTPRRPGVDFKQPKLGGGAVKGSNEDRAKPGGMGKKRTRRGNP